MQPATLMINDPELTDWIKKNPLYIYREKNGYALRNVAARLAVSRTTVSQWEDGTAYPTEANMLKVAKLMKIELIELQMQWRTWYQIKHAPEQTNGSKKETSNEETKN